MLAPDAADSQVQGYNFRLAMTRDPANRVTPAAPPGYRREDFVGVIPLLESGRIEAVFGYPAPYIYKSQIPPLPNGKRDINDVSRSPVRLSLPDLAAGWPDGDEAARRRIYEAHVRHNLGLLHFLQTDHAVPAKFRDEAREWGWCRDEFAENGHVPEQLYVRAGIVHPDPGQAGSVELAILADTALTERQKNSLLDVYASFLALNERDTAPLQ